MTSSPGLSAMRTPSAARSRCIVLHASSSYSRSPRWTQRDGCPGDRIAHGAVIPAESLLDLRGLTVVTQPHFVAERGEQYATGVAADNLPDLWRLGTLSKAGVSVAGGTDAPYGTEDAWQVMRAAVQRPPLFRADEAISPIRALSLFLGEPAAPSRQRLVAPGRPADLTLLRAGPLETLRSLTSDLVAATVVGGEIIYADLQQ